MNTLTPLTREALRYFDAKLKARLESECLGCAAATHVDSGDYATADTHSAAARILLRTHRRDGRIVTLTIGPPTAEDIRLAGLATPLNR